MPILLDGPVTKAFEKVSTLEDPSIIEDFEKVFGLEDLSHWQKLMIVRKLLSQLPQ